MPVGRCVAPVASAFCPGRHTPTNPADKLIITAETNQRQLYSTNMHYIALVLFSLLSFLVFGTQAFNVSESKPLAIAKSSAESIAELTDAAAADQVFHLRLVNSNPAKDETVAQMPDSLQLWFNQNVKLPVTNVRLRHGDEIVMLPPASALDDLKSFAVTLPDSTYRGPGVYTVQWATAGDDDHVIKGAFDFIVANE